MANNVGGNDSANKQKIIMASINEGSSGMKRNSPARHGVKSIVAVVAAISRRRKSPLHDSRGVGVRAGQFARNGAVANVFWWPAVR